MDMLTLASTFAAAAATPFWTDGDASPTNVASEFYQPTVLRSEVTGFFSAQKSAGSGLYGVEPKWTMEQVNLACAAACD